MERGRMGVSQRMLPPGYRLNAWTSRTKISVSDSRDTLASENNTTYSTHLIASKALLRSIDFFTMEVITQIATIARVPAHPNLKIWVASMKSSTFPLTEAYI